MKRPCSLRFGLRTSDFGNAVPRFAFRAPFLLAAVLACFEISQCKAAESAAPPPSAPAQSGSNKLEKLAMPIALHPDPLIAIILPASVYPLEIVQAARFVKDTNNIAKIDEMPWDDNVKAVARFPELIKMMDADLPWTMELGQAFLDQPKELMDTIQALRGKSYKAGTLKTSPQQVVTVTNVVVMQTNVNQVVTVTNQVVQVAPSNPQVVYVPSYPPAVYYPPPAYDPFVSMVSFGLAVGFSAAVWNNCNWGHGDVDINVNNNVNVDRGDRNVNRGDGNRGDRSGNRASSTGSKKWQPDQSRLNKSGAPSAQNRDARGWGGSGQASQRAGTGASARPSASTGAGGTRAGTANRSASPSASTANRSASSASRSASSPSAGARSSPSASSRSGSSAFSGSSSGGSARDFSSRGSSSRGGGGGGGGGRGGGGRGGGGRR